MTTDGQTALRRKTSEDRLGRLQVSDPDRLIARFGRLLEHRLKATTGLPAACRCVEYSICRMATLTEAAPENGSLAIGELGSAARGSGATDFAAAIIVAPELAARVIEASLDLSDAEQREEPRPVTRVDEALVQPFIEDTYGAFAMAMREVESDTRGEPANGPYRGAPNWVHGGETGFYSSGLRFSRYIGAPSALVDVEADEEMLSLRLEVAFLAGAAPITVSIYLTLSAVERLRGATAPSAPATPSQPPSDPVWARAMRRAATHADLKLTAVLRRMTMSAGDVGELRPGDVLPLSLDGGMDVTLALSSPDGVTEDGVLCAGYLGASGDRRAVMITESPHPSVVAEADAMTAAHD